jgi:hemerythrin-like domain-containing protein
MSAHILKLQAEHANYRKLLDLLEARAQQFSDSDRPEYELMSDIIYYMTQYPDRFHHPREDIAFRALLDRDPEAQAVVDVLANQHAAIARSGATLSADLGAAATDAMMSRATIETDVRHYVALMRGHMDQEEREIFPRLARFLKESDWFIADSAFHFQADPLFGESVQKRFQAIHRQIALQAGCGCTEAVEPRCCAA